jgi:hypothetical protein
MKVFILLLTAVALLSGCATSSVLVGKVRPAIAATSVKVYLRAPAKYEEIALLQTSSQSSWAFSEQGKMDAVMMNMKEEAAKLGANGVLLTQTGDKSAGAVWIPNGMGGGVMAPAGSHKAGTGMAIYVSEE